MWAGRWILQYDRSGPRPRHLLPLTLPWNTQILGLSCKPWRTLRRVKGHGPQTEISQQWLRFTSQMLHSRSNSRCRAKFWLLQNFYKSADDGVIVVQTQLSFSVAGFESVFVGLAGLAATADQQIAPSFTNPASPSPISPSFQVGRGSVSNIYRKK